MQVGCAGIVSSSMLTERQATAINVKLKLDQQASYAVL